MFRNYPVIGIPVDVKSVEGSPFHVVGEKYINAVAHGSKALPVLIPAFGEGEQLEALSERFDLEKLVDDLDGLFLPGSVSNVHPSHYQQEMQTEGLPVDAQRDATTLNIIKLAVEKALPLFAVCRGFQELNVAYGGTLHQKVHEVNGYMDHREDKTLERDKQYATVHDIAIVENGMLAKVYGKLQAPVNSLHGQGIETPGKGLKVEATAPDNLIEALSVEDAKTFALGVQWHPEWNHHNDPLSVAMFEAFGEAVHNRFASRK